MNKYKKLEIIRGGQLNPLVLANGDQYDSICRVIRQDGSIWHTGKYVNTDHTIKYNGGIVAESERLAGIIANSPKYGKCIRIFDYKFWDNVNEPDDWFDYCTLKSLVPNPNHGGSPIVTNVLYHKGGLNSDGSQACITEHPDEYNVTMDEFEIGEKILVSLERQFGWTAPDFYRGK